jgi:hypothetical protein
MKIELLGGCLLVDIFFEETDSEFDDNVCLNFTEPCSTDEWLFKAAETNIFLTAIEARQVAQTLLKIAEESDLRSKDGEPVNPEISDELDGQDNTD